MPRPWALGALLLPGLLAAESPEALLARIDRLRHPWPAFTVEVEVQDARALQRWRVRARENGDARVEGLSDKEKGRSVLLLGDQMWLLLPGTKRPLKVTPQQRLLGPAAGGDIARSRFAEDYQVTAREEDEVDGRPCLRLDLEARRPALSYRKVRLWATAQGVPLKAEFLLPSGRLAKRARFEPPVAAAGVQVLPGMTLEEPGGASARLRFSAWAPGRPDPALFSLPEPE